MHRAEPLISAKRRQLLTALIGMPLLGILPGCGGPGEERENDHAEREKAYREDLQRYAAQGYRSPHRYEVETYTDSWLGPMDEVAVSLAMPRDAGRYPLVVYLPGLGESVAQGALWRNTWAEAGYAVFAVQPQSAAQAWNSPRARNGDFVSIVQEQFSAEALAARIAAIEFALAEARSRATGAPYSRIDFSSMVIVGYDLGAQSAQVLIGEKMAGMAARQAPAALCAAMLLSPYIARPYVGVPIEQLSERYRDIRVPVLGITGVDDTDGVDMVNVGVARQIPFQYMSSSSLVTFKKGSHRLFSGSPADEAIDLPLMPDGDAAGEFSHGGGRGGRGPGGGRGGSHGGGGSPGGGGEAGDVGGEYDGGRERGGSGRGPGGHPHAVDKLPLMAEVERQQMAIKNLSTAFLDAIVKKDAKAKDWLMNTASSWVKPDATVTNNSLS